MKNALILHGNANNPQGNWFQWLKKELEQKEYFVWVPELPQSENPNIARYNKFIFENKDFQFNKETIIIGHSSGAVAIFGLLQELPDDITVNSVYLVGSFNRDLHIEGIHHEELFLYPFNFELIQKKSEKFVFIHSDDDPYCPLEQAVDLAKITNGELIVLKGQKHFGISAGGPQYKAFPKLLEIINRNTS